jgi:hypothetical protein
MQPKGIYAKVTTREKYTNPGYFFIEEIADKIRNAHSLQADLYWARHRNKEKSECNETGKWAEICRVSRVFLRFTCHLILYIFLIALGVPFVGWFWPLNFRRGVLSLGIGNVDSRQKVAHEITSQEQVSSDAKEKLVPDT